MPLPWTQRFVFQSGFWRRSSKNSCGRNRIHGRQCLLQWQIGTAAVFTDVPIRTRQYSGMSSRESLIHSLSTKFPRNEKSNVQVGPSRTWTTLPVREIMRRWKWGRALVGVTDLHIRDTGVDEIIDTRALSDFNILIRGTDDLSRQEMLTLVVASPGNVTDSHSDDPDGTNHCFFGKKLWLAWETFEGIDAGMQDLERQDVYGAAAFSMSKFLSSKSSRWFLVSSGETLFLPANLTHKVFTMEYYIGVGSFHVGLPGCLDNLSRWLNHGPLWSLNDPDEENNGLVDAAARTCVRIARRAKVGCRRTRKRWGIDQMPGAYRSWSRRTSSQNRKRALAHPDFRELVRIEFPILQPGNRVCETDTRCRNTPRGSLRSALCASVRIRVRRHAPSVHRYSPGPTYL